MLHGSRAGGCMAVRMAMLAATPQRRREPRPPAQSAAWTPRDQRAPRRAPQELVLLLGPPQQVRHLLGRDGEAAAGLGRDGGEELVRDVADDVHHGVAKAEDADRRHLAAPGASKGVWPLALSWGARRAQQQRGWGHWKRLGATGSTLPRGALPLPPPLPQRCGMGDDVKGHVWLRFQFSTFSVFRTLPDRPARGIRKRTIAAMQARLQRTAHRPRAATAPGPRIGLRLQHPAVHPVQPLAGGVPLGGGPGYTASARRGASCRGASGGACSTMRPANHTLPRPPPPHLA
jgi:hypothetical protein